MTHRTVICQQLELFSCNNSNNTKIVQLAGVKRSYTKYNKMYTMSQKMSLV